MAQNYGALIDFVVIRRILPVKKGGQQLVKYIYKPWSRSHSLSQHHLSWDLFGARWQVCAPSSRSVQRIYQGSQVEVSWVSIFPSVISDKQLSNKVGVEHQPDDLFVLVYYIYTS